MVTNNEPEGFLDPFHLLRNKGDTANFDLEQECGSGSGESGPFSVKAEAEARKFYRYRFHIGYLT